MNTVNTIYSHVIHVIPVFGLQCDHCDTLYHCILTKQGQVAVKFCSRSWTKKLAIDSRDSPAIQCEKVG